MAEANFKKTGVQYEEDDDDLLANDGYDDEDDAGATTCSLDDRPVVHAEEFARRIKALDEIANVLAKACACPHPRLVC